MRNVKRRNTTKKKGGERWFESCKKNEPPRETWKGWRREPERWLADPKAQKESQIDVGGRLKANRQGGTNNKREAREHPKAAGAIGARKGRPKAWPSRRTGARKGSLSGDRTPSLKPGKGGPKTRNESTWKKTKKRQY